MVEENTAENKKDDAKDNAGVKFPPPLIALIILGFGYWLGTRWPLTLSDWWGWSIIGWALAGGGVAIIVSGFTQFGRAKTSIMPHKPTSNIMQDGLYAYSRNPLYLAFQFIQGGVGIILSNFWIVLLIPVTMTIIRYYVIAREEAYLTRAFGDEYTAYTEKVARWL